MGLIVLAAGCATAPEREPFVPPVFPPPPEKPRYVFEHTLVATSQVERMDRTKRMRILLTGESTGGSGFSKPFDVVACKGRIYVSDSVSRRVQAFDFVNGRSFVIGDRDPGTLIKPMGLNTDAACNLYVADRTAHRVVVYDQDGNYRTALGGQQYFSQLTHIAVDPAGTTLFAVDTGGVESEEHHIRVLDVASGKLLRDIGSRGTEDGQLNLPRDIDLGPDGLLYVVDGGNFRIQVFTQDGKFVRKFGDIGRRYGQFARPKGIAVDPAGNVFVSDTSHGNMQIFSPDGQLLLFIGDRSSEPGPAKYMLPAGIDADEDGRIYLVEQFFRKVDVYRPADLPTEAGHLGAWALSEKDN